MLNKSNEELYRVPILFLLDNSESMKLVSTFNDETLRNNVKSNSNSIPSLNLEPGDSRALSRFDEGSKFLCELLKKLNNPIISMKFLIEPQVSCFNEEYKVLCSFDDFNKKDNSFDIKQNGVSKISFGIENALDDLNSRIKEYKNNNIKYGNKVLVVITDGEYDDNTDYIKNVLEEEIKNGLKLIMVHSSRDQQYKDRVEKFGEEISVTPNKVDQVFDILTHLEIWF